MNKMYYTIFFGFLLLIMSSCNSRRNANDISQREMEDFVTDSLHSDTLHHPSLEDFEDGHMPPPPPDGRGFDGPPPPPPHGKSRHQPDNMRGFDPAFEDDMDDNGMSRYMENNDEEGLGLDGF